MNHKRIKMVKEDFPHCIRLIHTIERQVFDVSLRNKTAEVKEKFNRNRRQGMQSRKKDVNNTKVIKEKVIEDEVELRIFELVDMFIRDSSLGLYESRLAMIQLLYQSLVLKQRYLISNDLS